MNATLPVCPVEVIAHYKKCFPVDVVYVDAVFAWFSTFDESCLTAGYVVRPLLEKAAKGDTFAVIALIVLFNGQKDPWLYERMGFHALADIQSLLPVEIRDLAEVVGHK